MCFKFSYVCGPIDWWAGFPTLAEYLHSRRKEQERYGNPSDQDSLLREAIIAMAATRGWEGDISNGPFVCALPNGECEPALAIVWKQSNNGSTFVVSEIRIPWLEETT